MPTKVALSLSSSLNRTEERKYNKSVKGRGKDKERSLTNTAIGKMDSTWANQFNLYFILPIQAGNKK